MTETVPVGADDQPILAASGLRKEYGPTGRGRRRRSDASPPGGSLAIVGESGSGKTTIARMLVGLTKPTAGTIVACGRDRSTPARSAAERRRRGAEIQIVFQDPYSSLNPRHSAEHALDEVLRLHRQRRHDGRLTACPGRGTGRDWSGSTSGCCGRCRGRCRAASASGSRSRGRWRPSRGLIILDESVAALDVSIQAQVLNLLADIRSETGVSYILISHDLAVVRQLTDDAIVMHRGKVVERGPTERILDDPQDEYTRMLRASVPGPGWKPSRRLRADAGVSDDTDKEMSDDP